jgi:hypothetical protein
MNKGLNLYFSETSWNQQQKCEVLSLTDIFSRVQTLIISHQGGICCLSAKHAALT